MEKYIIQHPYFGKELRGKFLEVEIKSENLHYTEIMEIHLGLQCRNQKNYNEIKVRCKEIADLIREIDNLNINPEDLKS